MAISIDSIAGLDPKIRSRLRAVGIEDIEQLLARGATSEGRAQLMSATGLSEAEIQKLLDAASQMGGASKVGVYGAQTTADDYGARKVGVYGESTPPPEPVRAQPTPVRTPAPQPRTVVEEQRGFPWWLLLLPLLLLALLGLFWWLNQRQQVATTAPTPVPAARATVAPTVVATVAPTAVPTIAPTAPPVATLPEIKPLSGGAALALGTTSIIEGKGKPGAVLELLDGDTVVGTTTVDANGNWRFSYTPTTPGARTLSVREQGATTGATIDVTVEGAPPAAAIPEIKPLSAGNTLLLGAPAVIEGKGTPGKIVELLDGDTVVGTTTVDANGNWLFAYTPTAAGARTLSVREQGATTAATIDVTVEDAPTASVTGVVAGIDPATLPPGAVLRIQMADFTGSGPAPLIAEQIIPLDGKAAPFPFKFIYDPRRVNPEKDYNVQGNIIDASGKMIYTTNKEFLVVTKGRPGDVEVTMVPAS
ncbi:MAG: DUF4332 domain-containing protein [Oscillochloridaceae bacterium]|nr:DUF4332 domain-containing protein [Chloroflexaceae bacterium]MDW8388825.1 DUF4332 domain-containing protein [Oscillochloridaceae bacterium]